MELKIKELSTLSGLSVRTLHYYDQIDLLKPSRISESSYRYYDIHCLQRLQQIMFFRELDFPLKDIRDILANKDYDATEILAKQYDLLLEKRKRIDRLIDLAKRRIKGEDTMSFTEFNQQELDAKRAEYAKEAKERWDHTEAYRESERRTSNMSAEQMQAIQSEVDHIFREFALCRRLSPKDERVATLVRQWQNMISHHFYECSDEMLLSLGELYVEDERFRENIDRHGEGTAVFVRDAIRANCR